MTAGDGSTVIPIEVTNKIIFVPPAPKEMRNMSVWCRPAQTSQSVQTTSEAVDDEELQSDPDKGTKYVLHKIIYLTEICIVTYMLHEFLFLKFSVILNNTLNYSIYRRPLAIPVLIPIPVPIYVPVPMMMYNFPAPVPFPCPIPIPTPVMMPVEPSLMDTVLQTIEESKKDMMIHQHPLEEEVLRLAEALGSSNDDCDPLGLGGDMQGDIPVALLETLCALDSEVSPLVGEDFEETLPGATISFGQMSRKRYAQMDSVPPSPKRFKPIITEKNSSDSRESPEPLTFNLPGTPKKWLISSQPQRNMLFASLLVNFLFVLWLMIIHGCTLHIWLTKTYWSKVAGLI